MLEYVIRLGWRVEFTFHDAQTALTFAQIAANSRTGEECDEEITITIRRKKEEVEDETDNV